MCQGSIIDAAMALSWIQEQPPRWNGPKLDIIGAAPEGAFDFRHARVGDLLPGDWWRVEDDGRIVGYGWLDAVWGDAEILLAVAPADQGRGVGSFILEHLQTEARERGLNYLYNVVRETHPQRAAVTAWLERHGFQPSADGALRRAVGRPPVSGAARG